VAEDRINTLDQFVKDGIFPVSFHNYGLPRGAADVKDWAQLGFTIGDTPMWDPEKPGADKREVLDILDACADEGMKCFVRHKLLNYGNAVKLSEQENRANFKQAMRDFGDHPALFGFNVGDEPHGETTGPAFRVAKLHREMAPHLTPFFSFGGYSPGGTEWMGLRSYRRYLDDYIAIANPNTLLQNNYYLCDYAEDAVDNYYRAVKMYTDASERHDHLPVWLTLVCTGHFSMRCPTEDDLRWQINSAAAHGVKGFVWFVVYRDTPSDSYRVPPIDHFGEKTETFYWLSRVLRTFHGMHGPTLIKLTHQRAFHVGQIYGGYPYTFDSELVKAARADFPLIVSEFKDDKGMDYVAVVSNARDGVGMAHITWHGNPKLFTIEWEGKEQPAELAFYDKDPGVDSAQTTPWFAPGQMVLYRVESDAPEQL